MKQGKKKKMSFVIPCYYSEKILNSVVDEIVKSMKPLPYSYEIVLVNDGSLDGTYNLIKGLAKSNKNIIGINFAKNFGQHSALMAGLAKTTGDYIVCLDDDGQTPANETYKLIEKLNEGYDVVYASYDQKQHNTFRNFGTKMNDWLTKEMLGKPNDLMITSFFAAKKYIIDEIIKYEQCFPYIEGLILRSTKNICNVPVKHRKRKVGNSGYNFVKLLSMWMNGFTSFSIKPLRVATYMGTICSIVGFVYMIYTIIFTIVSHSTPEGWSSLITIVLFLGGINLIVLGLIGEYIGRMFMCINKTPQYVIKEETRHEKK